MTMDSPAAVMPDTALPHCPTCGAANPGAAGGGTLVVVDTSNLAEIEAVLGGVLDELPCSVCRSPLGVTPTVAVVARCDREVVVSVTSLATTPEIDAGIRGILERAGLHVSVAASAGEVRGWLLRRWSRRLTGAFLEGWQADGDKRTAIVRSDPEGFDAEAFVAAALITAHRLPGAPFALTPDADVAGMLGSLATLQVRALLAVVERWSDEPERPVEPDLHRHVPAGGLLPGAPEKAIEMLTAMLSQGLSAPLGYATDALLASICAEAGRPNPRAKEWARAWLETEVLLERSEAPQASGHMEATAAPSLVVLRAHRIGEERARATLTRETIYDAAAALWVKSGPGVLEPVAKVASRAGVTDLASDLTAGIWTDPSDTISPQQLLDALAPLAAGRSAGAILLTADRLIRHLPDLAPAQVWPLADAMAGWWPDDQEAVVECELWAAAVLSRLDASAEFLTRVGDRPRPFEAALPFPARSALQWARADALITIGRLRDAEAALTDVIVESEVDHDATQSANLLRPRRTLAIVQRQLGDWEGAVAQLRGLATEGNVGEQLQTRHALLVAVVELGRLDEALAVVNEAVPLCAGPYRGQAPQFAAVRASLLAALDRPSESEAALREVPMAELTQPATLIPFASAFLTHPTLLSTEEGRQMGQAVVSALHETWSKFGRSNLTEPAEQALRLLALLAERLGTGDGSLWRALAELSGAVGRPDPMAAIALAAAAVKKGDAAAARAQLDAAFESVAAGFAGTRELSESYLSTRPLWSFIARVQDAVERSRLPAAYQRVVAELGRDIVGRTPINTAVRRPSAVPPWDETVATLPGYLAVVEWAGEGGGRSPVITIIADGEVRTKRAEPPPIELDRLKRRIDARLQAWPVDSAGDPFDVSEWQEAAEWLTAAIADRAPPDAAVALIEHPDLAQLPWHVALTPRWPTFTVPSWASLFAEANRAPAAISHIGCAAIPRFGEDDEVVRAFDAFIAAIKQFGVADVVTGEQVDRSALSALLGRSDLCALLCHGYVSSSDATVTWLVAEGGLLPLLGSPEAESEGGRRHRFTWSDADRLPRSSPVVVSAACKTALAHYRGADEQLGLYSALRRHGTRTLIAPRWDIPAAQTLPVFADVVARIVAGAPPPAAARATGLDAAERLPAWLAYSPSVTGGWWVDRPVTEEGNA